jgi:hypothetical protein
VRSSHACAQSIVGALVEAHGDDVTAMVRDMKRNAMQHTAGVRARAVPPPPRRAVVALTAARRRVVCRR